MSRSKKTSKKLYKTLHTSSAWREAIHEADQKIKDYRLKIQKLKAAIGTFEKQLRDGVPFPYGNVERQ